jgi:hypothetical protein
MAPAQTRDVLVGTGSPSSRRNKGKIVEAIQALPNLANSMETFETIDPDKQATVTDFLDFSEYLSADTIRSLTLLRDLDQKYGDASANLNELTKQYGKLPELPADQRKKDDAVNLREEISENVSQAVTARTLSHAEAIRMDENIERHCIRAKNILAKLMKMADEYPISRENSPKAESPEVNRLPPKLTFHTQENGDKRGPRHHRAPRITVPGEVLAPYELDYDSWASESDSFDSDVDEPMTPRDTPAPSHGININKIKLKVPKKDRKEKPPRPPRPAGAMGTNVHSAVAGISTSNALAKLQPPPSDAKNGDEHLPWLVLNAYELAKLRKRMKKNAIWSPSDTMIARELANLGRGYENYVKAKAEAEAAGEPFGPVPAQLRGETVNAEGAISVDALKSKDNPKLVNRGMKLNEAKKLKKENQAKEMAKLAAQEAAEEAESVVRVMKIAKATMANIFDDKDAKDKKPPAKTSNKTAVKKRKRESPDEVEGQQTAVGPSAQATKPTKHPLKRSKTETPVPVPQTITTKQVSPILPVESVASAASPAPMLTPVLETAPETLAPPLPSPKKSSTPILPPTREKKQPVKKETKKPEPSPSTRPRRNEEVIVSASSPAPTPNPAPTPAPALAPAPAPAPEALPAKRPSSSRSKASSQEPAAQITTSSDRPRRTSTARNTPAPPEPRQPSRRAKRPAPGVVTADSEGSTAVSVGKRSKATRKKAGPKKEKKDGREGSAAQEVFDEFDDEGNLIDPNEPRYCVCNRVSFGVMIGCENKEVRQSIFVYFVKTC